MKYEFIAASLFLQIFLAGESSLARDASNNDFQIKRFDYNRDSNLAAPISEIIKFETRTGKVKFHRILQGPLSLTVYPGAMVLRFFGDKNNAKALFKLSDQGMDLLSFEIAKNRAFYSDESNKSCPSPVTTFKPLPECQVLVKSIQETPEWNNKIIPCLQTVLSPIEFLSIKDPMSNNKIVCDSKGKSSFFKPGRTGELHLGLGNSSADDSSLITNYLHESLHASIQNLSSASTCYESAGDDPREKTISWILKACRQGDNESLAKLKDLTEFKNNIMTKFPDYSLVVDSLNLAEIESWRINNKESFKKLSLDRRQSNNPTDDQINEAQIFMDLLKDPKHGSCTEKSCVPQIFLLLPKPGAEEANTPIPAASISGEVITADTTQKFRDTFSQAPMDFVLTAKSLILPSESFQNFNPSTPSKLAMAVNSMLPRAYANTKLDTMLESRSSPPVNDGKKTPFILTGVSPKVSKIASTSSEQYVQTPKSLSNEKRRASSNLDVKTESKDLVGQRPVTSLGSASSSFTSDTSENESAKIANANLPLNPIMQKIEKLLASGINPDQVITRLSISERKALNSNHLQIKAFNKTILDTPSAENLQKRILLYDAKIGKLVEEPENKQ